MQHRTAYPVFKSAWRNHDVEKRRSDGIHQVPNSCRFRWLSAQPT